MTTSNTSILLSLSRASLRWLQLLMMLVPLLASVHLVSAPVAVAAAITSDPIDCSRELRMGQFICPDPEREFIDARTQQPIGCTPEGKAKVWCLAADGLLCSDTRNASFLGDMPCNWT